MAKDILIAGVFGLGIFTQSLLLIKNDFRKSDLYELAKDLCAGLLIVSLALYTPISNGESIPFDALYASIYVFYASFCIVFTWSFKGRMLTQINAFSLLSIDAILLYYCMVGPGIDNFLTQDFLLFTLFVVTILFKKEIGRIHKSVLYYCYMLLFLIIALKDLFVTWREADTFFAEYFVMGGFFLYVWVYIAYLLGTLVDAGDLLLGRKKIDNDFLDLAKYFEYDKYDSVRGLGLMFVLLGILLINHQRHYIPEGLLITLSIFFISIYNYRLAGPEREVPMRADKPVDQGAQN